MMIYLYIKKDEDVKRIGAECEVPEALSKVMLTYSEAGFQMAEPAEYDSQMIKTAEKQGETQADCDSKLSEEAGTTE